MTPRLGYVDSEPTVPVEAAHAASEFDSEDALKPPMSAKDLGWALLVIFGTLAAALLSVHFAVRWLAS